MSAIGHTNMSQSTSAMTQITKNSDLLLSAKNNYKNGDYPAAISAYTQAIDLDPKDATALCCRGVAYYRLGDIQKAMFDYNQSIAIDPNLAISYYRRGFLHYITKDYLSAIADYNKSIELQPDFALAYSNRSYAYRDLYGEQEATIDLRFAAKLFKQQGNMTKYHSTMKSINKISGGDSWGSGML
jgi:tetratricopeptide (TPR) repeat protein